MRIGIIGLARSGKSTVFDILTGSHTPDVHDPTRARVGMAAVPDGRVDWLSEHFRPKKTTFSTVEFIDFAGFTGKGQGLPAQLLAQMRTAEALLAVLRGYEDAALDPPAADPVRDLDLLQAELILADLATVETNVTRMQANRKKGAKIEPLALAALEKAYAVLGDEKPALAAGLSSEETQAIRGFGLLTLMPILAVANTDEETFREREAAILDQLATCATGDTQMEFLVLSAPIEREILQLDAPDRPEFMEASGLTESARDRLLRKCFALLDQICFFTVGEDEVRSWTIRSGTVAQRAAGRIHTDLEKGFIRAEVVAYEDFHRLGGFPETKKEGRFRLEGKEYPVKDGDILNIRFNV